MRDVDGLIQELEQRRSKLEYQLDGAMHAKNYGSVSFLSARIVGLREAIEIVRRWAD